MMWHSFQQHYVVADDAVILAAIVDVVVVAVVELIAAASVSELKSQELMMVAMRSVVQRYCPSKSWQVVMLFPNHQRVLTITFDSLQNRLLQSNHLAL